MSRQLMRALTLHDSASVLADHEARSIVGEAALKSATSELRRMEKASARAAVLGPRPLYEVVRPRDRETREH